jgi:hypothetical protein
MVNALQKALLEVQSQIAVKSRLRDTLNAEIAQLQATAIGLQNALGQQIQAETAWTDLIRTVIYNSPNQAMSAVEVRDTLQTWGYNMTGIKNPLAFVNTCLQRLAEQGEIIRSDVGRPFRFSCE